MSPGALACISLITVSLLLAGCQTTSEKPVKNQGTPSELEMDQCVNLLRKARLFCRSHGGSPRRSAGSFGGPTSIECMDARLSLKNTCGSHAKP